MKVRGDFLGPPRSLILDLHLSISTNIYDKHDDFDFEIDNFSF